MKNNEKKFPIHPIEFKRKSCIIMDLCVFFMKKVLDKRFGACLNQIINESERCLMWHFYQK